MYTVESPTFWIWLIAFSWVTYLVPVFPISQLDLEVWSKDFTRRNLFFSNQESFIAWCWVFPTFFFWSRSFTCEGHNVWLSRFKWSEIDQIPQLDIKILYSSSSRYFLISIVISSLMHGLIQSSYTIYKHMTLLKLPYWQFLIKMYYGKKRCSFISIFWNLLEVVLDLVYNFPPKYPYVPENDV